MTKFISLNSGKRNFLHTQTGPNVGYRPELNTGAPPGRMMDKIHDQEVLLKRTKTRKRKLNVLRKVLEGQSIAEVAEYYAAQPTQIRLWMSEMLQLLFFRAKDRTGLTTLPRGPLAMMPQAAFWLQKLNENEDVMMELDPAKLPSTQVAYENLAPQPARPVFSRSVR